MTTPRGPQQSVERIDLWHHVQGVANRVARFALVVAGVAST